MVDNPNRVLQRTIYSNLSNEELLVQFEELRHRSPIINELYQRFEILIDQVQQPPSDEAIQNHVESLMHNKNLTCPVCQAEIKLGFELDSQEDYSQFVLL